MKYAHVRVEPHVGALFNGHRSSKHYFAELIRQVTLKPLAVARYVGKLCLRP
jgi:hypothetical protein